MNHRSTALQNGWGWKVLWRSFAPIPCSSRTPTAACLGPCRDSFWRSPSSYRSLAHPRIKTTMQQLPFKNSSSWICLPSRKSKIICLIFRVRGLSAVWKSGPVSSSNSNFSSWSSDTEIIRISDHFLKCGQLIPSASHWDPAMLKWDSVRETWILRG